MHKLEMGFCPLCQMNVERCRCASDEEWEPPTPVPGASRPRWGWEDFYYVCPICSCEVNDCECNNDTCRMY